MMKVKIFGSLESEFDFHYKECHSVVSFFNDSSLHGKTQLIFD